MNDEVDKILRVSYEEYQAKLAAAPSKTHRKTIQRRRRKLLAKLRKQIAAEKEAKEKEEGGE